MRNKKFTVALAAAAFSFAGVASAATNLVVNGSFENITSFQPNYQDAMALSPGAAALLGWNVMNSSGLDLAWIGPTNPFSVSAPDGGYSLDLSGYHDRSPYSGVNQVLATVSGHTYSLGFDLGHIVGGTSSSILVVAGNTQQVFSSGSGANPWDHYVLTFIGITSGPTPLILLGNSASSGSYIGLDNVTVLDVTPVPEPETYAMLLAGLGLLGFVARRRKQKQADAI